MDVDVDTEAIWNKKVKQQIHQRRMRERGYKRAIVFVVVVVIVKLSQYRNIQNHLTLDVSLPLRLCFEFPTANTCDDYNALMFASF